VIRYPQVRWLTLVAALMGVVAPGHAEESLQALFACRGISDATTRLACFDRETASLARSSAPSVSPAPATVAQAPAAPVLNPEQKFGMSEGAISAREVAAGTRAVDLARIESHITALSASADAPIVFTLDNGQVWKQLKHGDEMLAKIGDGVTISRGLLGSYWLQLQSGRGCKVTRVR
jgi:hypothetical protein